MALRPAMSAMKVEVQKVQKKKTTSKFPKAGKSLIAYQSKFKGGIRQMYRAIWDGRFERSRGTCGLKKADLMMNRKGQVVSKRKSAESKRKAAASGWTDSILMWNKSLSAARLQLGLTGFCKIKKAGGSPKELALYRATLEHHSRKRVTEINKVLGEIGSQHQVLLVKAPVKTEDNFVTIVDSVALAPAPAPARALQPSVVKPALD